MLRAIEKALAGGDVREIARLTTRNFFGPIQTIIPWASNHYTETLIDLVRGKFGGDYWGFLMLGGISGGGMGFIFDPARKTEAQDFLQREMVATKRQLQSALPFAMDPVVYDFAINDRGTAGRVVRGRRRDDARGLLCDLCAGVAAAGNAAAQPGGPQRDHAVCRRLSHASAAGRFHRDAAGGLVPAGPAKRPAATAA